MAELEPVMVTMTFTASALDDLLAVLSNYVVQARSEEGCRNIDLVASSTRDGRLVIVEKWASREAQQRHFDSRVMVDMATACQGLLSAPPDIDLLEPITMHDLN